MTAPPNYGPALHGVRTLYDLLYDVYAQAGWLDRPAEVSFRDDVYPLLRRLSRLQWVNHGFAAEFGYRGPHDFENPDFVVKLAAVPAGKNDPHKALRYRVFRSFREPDTVDGNQLPWPWIYGDSMNVPAAVTPRQNAAVSPTQYRVLREWAAGRFVTCRGDSPAPPDSFDKVALQDQPAMLDRAALTFCLADAFHPGCEVTWPVRHLTLFYARFRIRHRPPGDPDPDYGPTLTPDVALSPTGPLHEQGPGDLTRWMGLPWQADTGFCRSGYDTTYDPFVPTFWPARVPNHVLTEPNYQVVIDPQQPPDRRRAAFNDRMTWADLLQGGTAGQMVMMVRVFGDMGLVEVRDGVPDSPDFPPKMMVAQFGPSIRPPGPPAAGPAVAAPPGSSMPLVPAKLPLPVHRPRRE
jgi:hypothetical protein